MTPLVEIDHLNIRFTGERTVHAVNDLSLSLGDGEVLGLLGESGSGKSVTLRALMRLLPKKRTEISDSVKSGLEIIPVSRMDEVLARTLVRKPEPISWEEPPVKGKPDAAAAIEDEAGSGLTAH